MQQAQTTQRLTRRLSALLSLAALATFSGSRSALAQEQSQQDAPVPPAEHPLQGQIQHDETLPPLSPQYNVGQTLDTERLTALTPGNEWFVIPSWFAGTWHSDEQTIAFLHDYDSGLIISEPRAMKEIGEVTYGTQRDKNRQVWSFIKIPRTQKKIIARGVAYLESLREDPLVSDQSKLVIKYLYNEIIVDENQHIKSVKQVQSINTYTQLEDGLVRLHGSLKSFDADGNPKVVQESEQVLKRIAQYENSDKDGALDLKQLFIEFLKKSGHQDLIPAS